MFVSVTRLRLRSFRFLPAFFIHAMRSIAQAKQAGGFIDGEVTPDRKLVFWTLTGWTDEAAMLAYRNSNAHRAAMPKLLSWCDEAIAAGWVVEGTSMPEWSEAYAKIKDGKLTKVRFPSAGHEKRDFPPPRLKIRQRIAVK